MPLSITNKTRVNLPVGKLTLSRITEKALGKKFQVSLVFADKKISKDLNKSYRNKNYPTNILTFNLSKFEGEIFINPQIAKKESSAFGLSYKNYIYYLFIHGLIHLKGLDHGVKMEKQEKQLRNYFKIS